VVEICSGCKQKVLANRSRVCILQQTFKKDPTQKKHDVMVEWENTRAQSIDFPHHNTWRTSHDARTHMLLLLQAYPKYIYLLRFEHGELYPHAKCVRPKELCKSFSGQVS
jgi:hypothetical protein